MKILLPILISFNILASIPTVEGLFRNPSNPDLQEDLAVLIVKLTVESAQLPENSKDHVKHEAFLKFLFENTTEGMKRIIVGHYPTKELENREIKKVTVIESLSDLVGKDTDITRRLIYSTLAMYAANDSSAMSALLKTISSDYMKNSEILNEEKRELLKKYAEYLSLKNEKEKKEKEAAKNDTVVEAVNGEEGEELVSPLSPEEEEQRLKVSELIKASMYNKGDHLVLKKDGRNFFWYLTLENLVGKFTNEEHNLKHLKISNSSNEVELIPNKVVTFSGKYLIPKSFEFKTIKDRITVDVENYYTINSRKKTFSQRIQEYKEMKIKEKPQTEEKEEVNEDMALISPSIPVEALIY